MSVRLTRIAGACAALIATILSGMVGGCGDNGKEQAQQSQKIDAIVSQSGGDWQRLSAADRDTLTRELGNGNAQTAYMNFQGRWTRLKGGKAAPPRPPGPPR
jgi:hypothetical protein